MNADASLKRKVLAELDWDPEVQAPGIAVSVQEGVVTVAGDVRTFAEKEAVAAAVRRVAGVHAVAMELEVTLAIPHRRSDAEIAASAAQALGWNTLIPADAIRLTVERGCITGYARVEPEPCRRRRMSSRWSASCQRLRRDHQRPRGFISVLDPAQEGAGVVG